MADSFLSSAAGRVDPAAVTAVDAVGVANDELSQAMEGVIDQAAVDVVVANWAAAAVGAGGRGGSLGARGGNSWSLSLSL